MAKYSLALALFLSATTVDSFHNFQPNSLNHVAYRVSSRQASNQFQRGVSSTSSPDFSDNGGESFGEALNSVTNAAKDSLSAVVSDFPDTEADEIAQKQQLVGGRVKTYKVTLPLASEGIAEGNASLLSLGFRLGQIDAARTFSDMELDMDTLEFTQPEIEKDGSDTVDRQGLARRVEGNFKGLIVTSVLEGGAAWTAGVRAGDILRTASATMGPKLWPKSTLEGVRSAVSSRRATSSSVAFEFQRLGEAADNQFELTLTRPIGLEMRETEDGYVEVTGFTQNAPTLVQYAVQPGDRVLAVESSLGGRMWPVSTVDGVISAVTGRLPGQQITLRFERVDGNVDTATIPKPPKTVVKSAPATLDVTSPTVPQKELLKRCRKVIQRYTTNDDIKDKFVGKFAVPGLVADKVVDALASAGASVDAVTLSMVMEAYLSCSQPQKAIDLFEAVVGLSADGSETAASTVLKGSDDRDMQIMANTEALDVFTVTALLKAHAEKGDLASVKRVLYATEGKRDMIVDGVQTATWPGTGVGGTLTPDTKCYNAVLSAAADSSAADGLDFALEMFEKMSDSKSSESSMPDRNLATYNIIINALTNAGRYDEAIDLFYIAKKLGLKPDKYTYTSLVKAAVAGDDAEELLYDMREQGVVADVVTYNTVIKFLCDERKLVAAKKIVNLMEESGVAPDSRTYGLLMQGLMNAKKPSAALTLFETACRDQRTVAVTENVYLYTTAITAAAKLGDHDRALELLSRMSTLGIKPNLKSLTALLGACLASGRSDLAVDVYRRISKPDGRAVAKGIIAYSQNGNFEEALSLVIGPSRKMLTGKEIMWSYESLIKSSLSFGDYAFAKRIFSAMLAKGDIPSKAIYQTIFDSMRLFPSTSNGRLEQLPSDDPEAEHKFQYLMYILDSIAQRNLPCDGPLYSAILTYGKKMGGLQKKFASLMVFAKTATDTGANAKKLIDDTEESSPSVVSTWSELLERYDEVKDQLTDPSVLPALRVRVGSKDIVKVLRAEKNLSYVERAKSRA